MKLRIFWLGLAATLTGCSIMNNQVQDGPPKHYVDASKVPNATPRYLPKNRFANPASYAVNGETYHVLTSAANYNRRGIASWYGTKFNGKLTSSGEPYNMLAMTAASKVLPIPCFVKVTNLQNGRQIIVKVNDRGPFAPNRIIDLSYVAAKKLDMIKHGTALVDVSAINVNRPMTLHPIHIHRQPELFLQIGAFADAANAHELKRHLTEMMREPVRIEIASLNHRPLYRVQVGPLTNVAETDHLKTYFEQRGFNHTVTVVS